MAPPTGSSAPRRAPLDARHAPYAATQRNTARKPKSGSDSQSSSSSWLSRVTSGTSRSSLSRACLRPTTSMIEEFEVEGLLGTIYRSDSLQSTESFHSALSNESHLFQSCNSSFISTGPRQTAPTGCSKGAPLSRTSTAATVLEFPDGPTDPSYGTFDIKLPSLAEFSDSDSIDSRITGEDSWVDAAQDMDTSPMPLALDMTFRCPLPAGDSDDEGGMDTTIIPPPLVYHDSTDSASCSSAAPSSSDLSLSSPGSPRKRIWEVTPEEYVPRPKGIPVRSVASVLEIGMLWERENQGAGRTRGAASPTNRAIGRVRRIHGDAQYMN
ncbi:unnamed protein product [Rhizoctonia solani]|uniref:Uncharacterized protein n=2 Tax=Rhizoctonia solani TaxID=456999 RepID=A0A8H3HUC2_9AGAM|nr:hypothetical protein RSOL_501650 [Rhizoctonia solani AG-3 Rhs1AP]CAE6523898.1 unnamed protein product [Rhizoctonia solani]CAE6536101.1 unnamed protein product [Rhizoctonia solani]